MAPRKNPHTEAVLDNSSEEGGDVSKVERAIPLRAYNSVIRRIRNGVAEQVQSLLNITDACLVRLEVPPDLSTAETRTPQGSDQFDVGTFKVWAESVVVSDTEALAQLISIDATARQRVA